MIASWAFDGWPSLWHVAATATVAYAALVVLLRIGGKRTLAQLTIFDWIVTVALGSTLASTITAPSVSLADGVAAVAILVGLQTAVAFASTRSARAAHLLTGEPVLVAHHGRLLEDALRRQRLTGEQVLQAVRAAGCASLEDVGAVVLEPNGNLSILGAPSGRALDGVGR